MSGKSLPATFRKAFEMGARAGLCVTIHGSTVKLSLNDKEITKYDLEPNNRRTSACSITAMLRMRRIRNLVYRGNWPKLPPSLEQQELANSNSRSVSDSRK